MTGIEVVLILGLLALLRQRGGTARPMTLDELTASPTARRLGIDNAIPESLLRRARGLGVVGGLLRSEGFRVTSAFRSAALTQAIHAENAARDLNTEYPGVIGPGDHGNARALDVAPTPPSVQRSALIALRDAVLASSVGPLIVRALVEDDHVHLRFDETALERLGSESE